MQKEGRGFKCSEKKLQSDNNYMNYIQVNGMGVGSQEF